MPNFFLMGKRTTIYTLFLLSVTTSSLAQINIPAATIVSENFNSIGSSGNATLPLNWKMSSAGTGAISGWATGTNITATTQAASSGSPTTGGAYNWATTAGTDRAIGFMTDGSYASPNSVMAFYRNTTGSTVTTITVLFAIERYRVNTSTSSLSFFSSTDGSAWTARAAGDISAGVFTTGASTYNFTSPQTIYKTVTITGLSIANNGDFYLRWVFTNTGSTNSQGIALDDVSLFAGTATPAITAKLRDALTIDNGVINQANPGDQLTYTTTIKNTGTGDANSVNLTQPAPTNTTLVGGSVKTSALAKDDSYSTPFNTALTGNNILTNDFGLPAVTVVSFGPVKNAAATAAGGSGSSDNGATVVVNPDGTFSYTPPSGFIGIDKFAYIITTGNAPDNDAIVTISVGTAPSVTNDSYTAIGNMQINPIGTSNLLNNDAGNGIQIVAVNGNPANVGNTFTTANGSNLTVSANGDFIYNPGPGFDGPESFTYTIDNGFSSPQTATVNITISGMVWFINAAAAAGGDGRLSAPFNTIAAYNAAAGANPPAANDNIFVYENPVPYSGSFTLLNGQRLIGQDASASLSTITGLTPAAYSSAFPAMNTGAPVTTLITTVAATNAVNLGSGNILRGFTLGNTTSSGINGTGFGTLVIADVSKNGTGQAVALSTGAFGSPATIDNITTTSSVNAVSLAGCTGTLTISTGAISGSTGSAFTINGGTCSVIYSGGITQANNAAMVSISGGHATGTITFQAGTLSATNGTGLQFDNADGIYNFNGTTTLNGGDAGIDILNGSAGAFTFGTGTGITSPSGIAFNIGGTASTCIVTYNGSITQANNAAMVSVSGGHTTGTVTFQTGTLSATNGTGLQFDNADGIYNFNGTTTLNGGDAGIDIINGSGGNFSFNNAPITNPTGVAFLVNGGNGSIGHAGAISKVSSGRLIDIQSRTGGSVTINDNLSSTSLSTGINVSNCTGGTITFAGATKTMNTPGSNPVNLATNTGSTINFTGGGLAITSTTATGFNATGGGTISVTTGANNNTIVSTTGTALNVVNTTIGAGGLNFRSIAANGAASGIILNSTGSGGLTVSGDGGGSNNNSGGVIQNTTSHGVSLTSVANVRLNYMGITNNLGSGISGSSINGFQMNRTNITGNGNDAATDESGVNVTQLTGTAFAGSNPTSITNCTISNNNEFELQITNSSGTLTDLQMSGNTISSNGLPINGNVTSPHGNLVNFLALGTANMTTNVTSGSFIGNWNPVTPPVTITATAMQCDHSGTGGTMTANISGCTFTNNNVGPQVSVAGGGQIVFNFRNNTITGSRSIGINLFADANPPFTKNIIGKIENNTIGTQGVLNSGSSLSPGIRVQNEGSIAMNLLINNNTIQEIQTFQGINVNVGISLAAGGLSTNLTITNNIIRDIHNSRAIAIQDNATTAPFPTVCANISGNVMSNVAGQAGDGTYIRVRRLNGVFNVTQASLAALEAANTCNGGSCNGLFAPSGTITYGQPACILPSN